MASALFRGVDRAVFAAGFAQALSAAGIPTTTSTMARFATAIEASPPRTTRQLYWLGRICLVTDHRFYDRYDKVFAAVFDQAALPTAPMRRNPAAPSALVATGTTLRRSAPTDGFELAQQRMTPSVAATVVPTDEDDNGDKGTVVPEYLPTEVRELADRSFDELDEAQLALITGWIDGRSWRWPTRPTRRTRPGRHGEIDLRATLRSAARHGGVPTRLARRARRRSPRRVVLLVDTSASMERYAAVYLHLVRAFVQTGHGEAFCFGTGLARVTAALRHRDPETVIERVNETITDRFSGTRIASSIAELLNNRIWSELPRGAIVVVVTDGWDADAPELLARNLARLHRRAKRVIWVNPRAGDTHWEPGLPAARILLDGTDALVAGHTLRALLDLVATVLDDTGSD